MCTFSALFENIPIVYFRYHLNIHNCQLLLLLFSFFFFLFFPLFCVYALLKVEILLDKQICRFAQYMKWFCNINDNLLYIYFQSTLILPKL
jgi:hypothetical protein